MLLLAIGVVSAAVLGFEVLLVRLLAIIHWQQLAAMVISIALLGFGVSGTVLALARTWLESRFTAVFAAAAALFGASALFAFVVAQRVPFNVLEILWSPSQLLYLAFIYALLILPFFFGGLCVGLSLVRFAGRIGRVYGVNLFGSGVGALAIVLAQFALQPTESLRLIAGLGFVAAACACLDAGGPRWRAAALAMLVAAVVVPTAVPQSWTALRLSPYKGLSKTLHLPGVERIGEFGGPLGQLSVIRSPNIPFRHAPGLSLNHAAEPPAQIAVFTDGDAMTVITQFDGRRDRLDYLDQSMAALPYHLLERPRVLVLGAGGGADVLQAMVHDARQVDAVELDPRMAGLVARDHAEFAGGLYTRPDINVVIAEARGFVQSSRKRWDLIHIPLLDSFAAAAAGVHSLRESYIYTEEAFRIYLRRLETGGLLAVTRWLKLPPRDSLKLFLTALRALEADGVEAASRLVLARSWNTTILLVKNEAFTADDIDRVRRFATERSFDLAYYPGIREDETNRWNVLDAPYLFAGARALTGAGRADYVARYRFDLRPATDDKPFFFDFFKWRTLPEIVALQSAGVVGLFDWGYLILFATIAQAAVVSLALILLPLYGARRTGPAVSGRTSVALYFLALGLAFLFVEIAFIQRFILFLSHPLYAVAVVLAGFLVFAGLGSSLAPALAGRLSRLLPGAPPDRIRQSPAITLAVVATAVFGLLYLVLLPPLFGHLIALGDTAKIAVSLALIAPLAVCMGMPFPLGLTRLAAAVPELVPWAWGINGCASVLGALLAAILAIHLGFAVVVVMALLLYALAAWCVRRFPTG